MIFFLKALNDTEEAQDTQGTSFGTQKQNQGRECVVLEHSDVLLSGDSKQEFTRDVISSHHQGL